MEVILSSMEAKPELITLDLLGGCSSKDLDLGLNSSSFSCHAGAEVHLLDLNLLPQEGGAKSVTAAAPPQLAASQSVCTIEKVKWALERAAERESRGRAGTEDDEEQAQPRKKRPRKGTEKADGSVSPSPSSSSSITTASVKRRADGGGEEGTTTSDGCDSAAAAATASRGSLVAAGCPSCLSYVLITRESPSCPRCEAEVPPPATAEAAPVARLQKKPRIDLNFALGTL